MELTRALRLLLLAAVLLCGFAGSHLAEHRGAGLTDSDVATPQSLLSSTVLAAAPKHESGHTKADAGSHGPADEACLTVTTFFAHQYGCSKEQAAARRTIDLDGLGSPAAGPAPAHSWLYGSLGLQLADLSVRRT